MYKETVSGVNTGGLNMAAKNAKPRSSGASANPNGLSLDLIPGWTADKIVVNGQLMTIVYPKDSKQLYT